MRHYFWRPKLLLSLFAVLALLGIMCVHVPILAKATSTCGSWTVVPSPNINASFNNLWSTTAITASDVWAVGSSSPSGTLTSHTLTEHFDGTTWSIIPSPDNGPSYNNLYSVSAIASNDVWMVGDTYDINVTKFAALFEHWNGSQWSVIPSPDTQPSGSTIDGVSGTSSTDVWAVGHLLPQQGPLQTLIEHWDGMQWSIIPSPSLGSGVAATLRAVVALSSHNAWAVGDIYDATGWHPLFEHWDGTQWSVVPVPAQNGMMSGVAAVSAHNVFAVGRHYTSKSKTVPALIDRWHGTTWNSSANPAVPPPNSLVADVALSATNAWAIGYSGTGNVLTPFIEHWNGFSWSLGTLPDTGNSTLLGITGIPGTTQAWAVGSSGGQTLIESYC